MPRWWLWTFYATIVWALVYFVLYPACHGIEATAGVLGWSSAHGGGRRRSLGSTAAARKSMRASPPQAWKTARRPAHAVRRARRAVGLKLVCVQCHGSGAQGSPGYPNLNDDDWLWGGRWPNRGDHRPRRSAMTTTRMPVLHDAGFGDGILKRQEVPIRRIRSALSGTGADAEPRCGRRACSRTNALLATEDRRRRPEQGAPNLTDAIWLYGGDTASRRAAQSSAPWRDAALERLFRRGNDQDAGGLCPFARRRATSASSSRRCPGDRIEVR